MNKAIVFGANGFLGANLTRFLSKRGVTVYAFVPKGFDYTIISGLPNVNCIEFMFDKLSELDGLFKDVDLIYNFVWVGVGADSRNNEKIQSVNLSYNIDVLQYAQRNGIKRILIPGSASEYACCDDVIDGYNMPAPSDIYSATKIANYYLCNSICAKYGIELIYPIITSIYGPGRDDNNLLSYVIKELLQGKKPSTTKLEQKWDYLYIDDLINALFLLGQKGKGGVIYPVGYGHAKQISEYVNVIRDLIDPSLEIGIGDKPYKSIKIDNQIMDISKLVKDTGFKPEYSFEQGIKKVIDYFKSIVR